MNHINRRKSVVIISIFIIIIIGITPLSAMKSNIITSVENKKSIEISYKFEQPTIKEVNIADKTYDNIEMINCEGSGKVGEPSLPASTTNILLPPKSKLKTIQVDTADPIKFGSGLNIRPVAQSVPLSQIKQAPLPIEDERIYGSNQLFPENIVTEICTQQFRGYTILILQISPVQYNPIKGEIQYFPTININIETSEDQSKNQLYRGLEKDEKEIFKRVANPNKNLIKSYKNINNQATLTDPFNMLIICAHPFKPAFEKLALEHTQNGVITQVRSLHDILGLSWEDHPYDLYEFFNPTSIRNVITETYLTSGIDYVLIGGDTNIIPAQQFYLGHINSYPANTSTDLYYSCLDDPFNYDGDMFLGEPGDGPNGGEVDLTAEVYVGRACADTLEEAYFFVNKTINYMNTDYNHEYLNKIELVSELLWPPDPPSYYSGLVGAHYMDELIDGSERNSYFTIGMPQLFYDLTTNFLSDRNWPGFNIDAEDPWDTCWPKVTIIDIINQNYHVINHIGHACKIYVMRMENTDVVESIENDKYSFMYSQGCFAGSFDNVSMNDPRWEADLSNYKDIPDDDVDDDCIAEYLTVKNDHGAFAVIMNARYGWGNRHGTDGASQRYNRHFWNQVFNERILQIGKANQLSKEPNIGFITNEPGDLMRWCYYVLNLLGDPAVKLKVLLDGDANNDGSTNIGDVVFIINYVFRSGPAPEPICRADVNNDWFVDVGDAVYLINYIFRNGPAPELTCNLNYGVL